MLVLYDTAQAEPMHRPLHVSIDSPAAQSQYLQLQEHVMGYIKQCGHLLWCFAIQQQSTAPQSGHALLTQVRSMCS